MNSIPEKINVLIVEDDATIADAVKQRFEFVGWNAVVVNDGALVCEAVTSQKFNAIVMDIMLPNVDGFTLIRQVRSYSDVPIIMLSALTDIKDEVEVFELGADDFLRKPLRPSVLIAHVKRQIERYESLNNKILESGGTTENTQSKVIEISMPMLDTDEIQIDDKKYSAYRVIDGKPVELDLTKQEFLLMRYLVRNPNKNVTRIDIQRKAWGWKNTEDTRSVDTFIKVLRRKIGAEHIKTVQGVGYRYLPSVDSNTEE